MPDWTAEEPVHVPVGSVPGGVRAMAFKDCFRALGGATLPPEMECDGRLFRLQATFKHNVVTAVGLYQSGKERLVLKSYRRAPLFGVPTAWAGSLMARYEAAVMRSVEGIRGVPRLRGRYGPTGIMREYVPGRTLKFRAQVDTVFLKEFFHVLRRLHRRGIAHVDLEKAENILMGEDGLPYIIDFQVAFYVPERLLGGTFPFRWLRKQLQRADLYHARKHFWRLRAHALTPRQVACLRRKPWTVKVANAVYGPYRRLRRWLLGKV